eukprot:TRINITY_DN2233_c0_g2_i1.p1 TRINITY_DN2233_c0_g2~~TRINITY_DN2233_c0_g2_i1.p1  ORF type:complete len:370 (-),score=161.94 TRINITY_DN2233_c0_g2_i1:42-1151(-)
MPPKASKKEVQKQKQKLIEDKTFGLKNKNKSKKVQKFVQGVQKQVTNNLDKKLPGAVGPKKSKAELEKEKVAEMAAIMKVAQTKVPLGVDPKSVLCEFFKQGLCTKGTKCKYSHDLNVQRKAEKIDIYTDRRGLSEEEKATDSMADWNQEKLSEVVKEKHQGEKKEKKMYDIVCKHFLDAIEKKKYGWFWVCPGGGVDCPYLHALPPGFVLKEKEKEPDEDEEEIPIEELIEEQRLKLTTRTPVTLELFLKWKEEKIKQKQKKMEEDESKRKADLKVGKTSMSGREMFIFNPELFVDDEDALDEYEQQEDEGPVVELSATATSISAVNIKEEDEEGEEKQKEHYHDDEDEEGEEDGEEEEMKKLSLIHI